MFWGNADLENNRVQEGKKWEARMTYKMYAMYSIMEIVFLSAVWNVIIYECYFVA